VPPASPFASRTLSRLPLTAELVRILSWKVDLSIMSPEHSAFRPPAVVWPCSPPCYRSVALPRPTRSAGPGRGFAGRFRDRSTTLERYANFLGGLKGARRAVPPGGGHRGLEELRRAVRQELGKQPEQTISSRGRFPETRTGAAPHGQQVSLYPFSGPDILYAQLSSPTPG